MNSLPRRPIAIKLHFTTIVSGRSAVTGLQSAATLRKMAPWEAMIPAREMVAFGRGEPIANPSLAAYATTGDGNRVTETFEVFQPGEQARPAFGHESRRRKLLSANVKNHVIGARP
jgi:hypothetical protein